MKILALESSAVAASVAVSGDGRLLAQSYQHTGLTHSRTLMPMCRDLLKNCGLTLEEMDVVAVAAGPGSFTGLRIGVAAAKGLAWPTNKLCAGVSTLRPCLGLWRTWRGTSVLSWMPEGIRFTMHGSRRRGEGSPGRVLTGPAPSRNWQKNFGSEKKHKYLLETAPSYVIMN